MLEQNKFYRILFLLFASATFINAQVQNSISGFVKDYISGEPLPGTSIVIYKDSLQLNIPPYSGVATNNYGFFVIPKIEAGNYIIIVRHLGYKTVIKETEVTGIEKNTIINIDMNSEDIKLEEIIITGRKEGIANVSRIDIEPELMAKLPTLTGEMDLFRSLQMLPGVKAATEMSNGLYVRGGSPDQTLTLVDGVIMYNPSHLGNIASTFNSSAIRDIKLIKGSFPAQYGGRLSSVLDIKLRSGTREREKGTIGVGLLNSFVAFEGPLTGNSTYLVSARGMYYDFMQKKFDKEGTAPRYNFYDVNSKLTFEYPGRNIVSVSFMLNRDKLYNPPSSADIDYNMLWDNKVISLNWLHINSENLFMNTSVSYIDYVSESFINRNPESTSLVSYNASSGLTDINFKQDAEVVWHHDHTLKLGIELNAHNYDLIYSDVYDSLLMEDPYLGSDINSFEAAFYIQNESQFSDAFSTNIGGRLYYLGDNKYLQFEPRVSASYAFSGNFILKAGFGIANQYLHLLSRNDISLPADIWFPSTPDVKPGRSMQVVLGVDSYLDDMTYLLSVEGYYKYMQNLYEFNSILNYDLVKNNLEDQFTKGEGESYGFEFFLNKVSGRFTGWIGYTLSWTKRQFDALNGGKIFYPRYDRRHDVSLVLAYDISQAFSTGITWTYATGARYTLPGRQFVFSNIGLRDSYLTYDFNGINESFMPDYHKLDISFLYKLQVGSNQAEVYLNFFNVYNRNNPFAQYLTIEKDKASGKDMIKLKRISYFPFIPSLGFNFKF